MNGRFFLAVVSLGIVIWLGSSSGQSQTTPVAVAASEIRTFTWPTSGVSTMEVAEAVMVTVELNFGAKTPSIADALRSVDRRYQPDDGQGRTFAILDAYGEPTADGKLHISMHVSSEKTGRGALVFRPTGQILWHSRIVPATHPVRSSFAGKNLEKNLDIMIADAQGTDHLLNGSGVSQSILEAVVPDQGMQLREFWPDGAERQVTFFYSACGCPVKIMCRRLGEQFRRTKELPVIFPDDPDVVVTIGHLLGWNNPL